MTRAALFTGQGSAHRGMGRGLWSELPDEVAIIDEVLGYSVRELCEEDRDGRLRQTEFAQPAIFAVSALQVMAAPEALRGLPLAGHSLGELVALFAGGAFDLRTGITIVRERGRLMGEVPGGMVAVLGLDAGRVAGRLRELGLERLDLANLNTARQQVLAGPEEELERAVRLLADEQVRCVRLPVSGPFHSRYQRQVQARFAEFLPTLRDHLSDPRQEVYANVDAAPYRAGCLIANLVRQIVEPVRWHEILLDLRRRGVEEIVEIGPGAVQRRMWLDVRAEPAPAPRTDAAPRSNGGGTGEPVPAARRRVGLGSQAFLDEYGVTSTCVGGAMAWGIASTELVGRLADNGQLAFFGSGGLEIDVIAGALGTLRERLGDRTFGMNLLHSPTDPELEERTVSLYLEHGVDVVEAAAFASITPALVRFRFSGAHRDGRGVPRVPHRVIAKVSRPEVAVAFLAPPDRDLVDRLVANGALTRAEADIAAVTPVAQDICIESDSGGHTDGGVALVRLPSLRALCRRLAGQYSRPVPVRVGAAGGLGTPEAVAATYLMGADFIVLGSVNQCSPEAGTSSPVKEMLAGIDVQGTALAPAGDMFEYGAKVQVVRTGTMFAARGNKLYQLYQAHDHWSDIDQRTRTQIERTWFRCSYEEVQEKVRRHRAGRAGSRTRAPSRSAKGDLADVLRWYFAHTVRLGLDGEADRANYQIQCGPAMGAFNNLVRGTQLEKWPDRHVDRIAGLLMSGAEAILAENSRQVLAAS